MEWVKCIDRLPDTDRPVLATWRGVYEDWDCFDPQWRSVCMDADGRWYNAQTPERGAARPFSDPPSMWLDVPPLP